MTAPHRLVNDSPAQWARAFVRRLVGDAELPAYGSPEWEAADWSVMVASAVRAAEVWRRDGLFLADDLAAELERSRQWLDDDERAFYAAVCRRLAKEPTHAELTERRAS